MQLFLLFLMLLKLFDANHRNPFADFIYQISRTLLLPFRDLVADIHFGRYVLEGKTLIAILAYMAVATLIGELIRVVGIRI